MRAMHELSEVVVNTELGCGDVVLEDVAETGVSVIVTSFALMKLGEELENKNAELEKRASSGGGASAAMDSGDGIGIVRNSGNSEELGYIGFDDKDVDSFVSAAGEAVGVECTEEEEDVAQGEAEETDKLKSRPHIKRK